MAIHREKNPKIPRGKPCETHGNMMQYGVPNVKIPPIPQGAVQLHLLDYNHSFRSSISHLMNTCEGYDHGYKLFGQARPTSNPIYILDLVKETSTGKWLALTHKYGGFLVSPEPIL